MKRHYLSISLLFFLLVFSSCPSDSNSQQTSMSESDKGLKEIDEYFDFLGGEGHYSIDLFEWETVATVGNDIKMNYRGKMSIGKNIETNKNFLNYSIKTNPRSSRTPGNNFHEFAHIYPSRKLYIKLDNGEVLTFTCEVHNLNPIDFNRKTITYEDESCFTISDSQLNKFFSHKVIKMRADVAHDEGKTNICEYQIFNYQNPRNQFENEYKRIKKERKEKSDLDNNPLKDF